MRFKNLILTFLILNSYFLFSQNSAKFGKIDINDLKMKFYENDSSAPAIFLTDYGRFDSKTFWFTRFMRIKILKKEGLSWANQTFKIYSKSNIKGITYNLQDGKIITTKLNKSSIISELVTKDHYEMHVPMPNVNVGSIIDIEYSFQGMPSEWHFQKSIPVLWSELIVEESPDIKLSKNFFGYEKFFINENERWVIKNAPAFKNEPYSNAYSNYITKFEFDIISLNAGAITICSSWNNISFLLLKDINFGLAYSNCMFMNKIADELKDLNCSEKEKIEKAFQAVKVIKWNQKHQIYTSNNPLKIIYDKKIGNSAEINLILLALLRKIGFNAHPVVLSTRDNGLLPSVMPSLNKLNHVIVLVQLNNEKILIDATEDYLPYDILPKKSLNSFGMLVMQDSSTKVKLTTNKKDKQNILYNVNLSVNLGFNGSITTKIEQYAAFDLRSKFFSFNSKDEYLNDFLHDKTGLKIVNYDIKDIEKYESPVVEKYEIEITDKVEKIGDEYYFKPFFYHQLLENPFKMEERKLPVDFVTKIDKTISSTINLPPDYEIVMTPKPVRITTPENSATFTYSVNQFGTQISIISKIEINKEFFLPNEYEILREFFNAIVSKQSEPIVLKKKI